MNDFGMKALGDAFVALLWLCVIFVPLGAWKAVELISWAVRHVHIG